MDTRKPLSLIAPTPTVAELSSSPVLLAHFVAEALRESSSPIVAPAMDDDDFHVNAVRIKASADRLWYQLCALKGHVRPYAVREQLLEDIRQTRAEIARLATETA